MTAPTEAEIRASIEERVRYAVGNVWQMLEHALDPISDSDHALTHRGWADGFYPQDNHPGTLWADMTADEAEALNVAISAAIDFDRIADTITESVVAAVTAFAEKYPDIPRGTYGHREPVPA
jgi:hypothetical protein